VRLSLGADLFPFFLTQLALEAFLSGLTGRADSLFGHNSLNEPFLFKPLNGLSHSAGVSSNEFRNHTFRRKWFIIRFPCMFEQNHYDIQVKAVESKRLLSFYQNVRLRWPQPDGWVHLRSFCVCNLLRQSYWMKWL